MRSRDLIFGKPGLSAREQHKVDDANQVLAIYARLLQIAIAERVPWITENPQSSLLWHVPCIKILFDHPSIHSTVLHQCQFGTPYRKATLLLHHRIHNSDRLFRVCKPLGPRNLCSRSGCPHHHLSGSFQGKPQMARAAAFPDQLCSALAKTMIDSSFVENLGKKLETVFLLS